MKIKLKDIIQLVKENNSNGAGSEFETRIAAAYDRSTDPKKLLDLSKDENINVRATLAQNISAPPEALLRLSKDESTIRYRVATNPSTPSDALIRLSSDKDWAIRAAVAGNPNTPQDILLKLYNDDEKSYEFKDKLASNPNSPEEILLSLRHDNDNDVVHSVLNNPSFRRLPKEKRLQKYQPKLQTLDRLRSSRLETVLKLKEEFENSFEVNLDVDESEWESAEPENKTNWEKQLSLGGLFFPGKKEKKKKEPKKKIAASFLVIKDKK